MNQNSKIEELVGAKRQLEALFKSMHEGLVVQDSSGKVIQYNPSALHILNLTEDQLLGKTSYDPEWQVVGEDLLPFPRENHPAIQALKTGRSQVNQVLGVYDSIQNLKWLKVSAIPLFKDHEKKPYQVLVTFSDITKEKKAIAELSKKEKELSRILNNLPALIGYWDHNLTNVSANEAYSQYFGRTPTDIKGKHISEILGGELYKKNLPFIEAVLNGQTQTFEREIPLPNGEKKQTLATYLPDVVGNTVLGFFVIVTDISYIKKLESERKQIEEKIVNSSKLAALGEMAGGIAHEVNNPLAIILAKASQLKNKVKNEKYDAVQFTSELEKIENTVERITKIVRGLLAFSRDDKNQKKYPNSLKKIFDETLNLCYEKLKSKGIDLFLEINTSVQIICQPIEISQILLNLLNNAIDAAEKEAAKWIRVEVLSTNSSIQVNVIDSGKGISKEVVERMMIPFFTTKEIGQGTGLGLSISKGLAESNGATLNYVLKDGHTCFVLEFPINLTIQNGV